MGRVNLSWVALLLCALAMPAGAEKADVRVLIDISGSMRQNDPDNLRRPALRMLSGLLQPETRAGVWTFARWVNNLMPVAQVDDSWKQRVRSLSTQIASPGQFTNIEEVLDRASRDWQGKPATHTRHLVLLTDGMVDVSKAAGENAQSRTRILDTLLPRLKADAVKVHTIALSARADHELMQRLAEETGGWYQQVEQADELQRAFLRMFEQVGVPDTVPLQDNRFTVDGAVSEATVLVFSQPGGPPVVLHSPAGESYSDSDLPAGIAWHRDQGYDLITLASPQKGEWRLEADIDPDNRVMVVTDLTLQTSEIPAHLAAGEQLRVEANLSNRDKVVTRKAFLRLLDVRADTTGPQGRQSQPLIDSGESPDERAGDGRYAMYLGLPQPQDELELLVAVESPTFMREKRFHLVVHEPVEATIVDGDAGPVLLVSSRQTVMQPGVSLDAWQQPAGGARIPLTLETAGEGEWKVALADPVAPSYLQLSGTSRLGNLIERTLGPLMVPGAEPPPVTEVAVAEEAAAEPEPAAEVAEPVADPVTASEPAEDPEAEESWVMPAIVFGAFNLLLLIAAGVWFLLRRRRASKEEVESDLEDLIEELPPTEAGESLQENAA
jgi:uncharacterized protein (TIGR03503 family)